MNLFKILALFLFFSLFSLIVDTDQCLAQCNTKFTATTEGGKTGEMVTVKITVANFTDIGGIQWTLRWDPAVIDFVAVQDFALTDLSLGSFNLTKVAQGYLTTSWYNQQGVTKADGTVIFTIKFKLLGVDGKTSNIDFSNTPLQIEISDKNAQKCNNAVLTGGKVNVGTVAPGLGLKVGTSDANGQEVCVPVTVTGFKSITAMQFSLGWDTSKLKFTKLQNLMGITPFDVGNFGTALGPLGKISCVWIDQNTTGQTVTDGKALFEICFTYKGTCPGSTGINITDDPTKVVFNSTTGALSVTKEAGTVNSGSCSQALNVVASKITQPCPGQNNGGIEITTSGGSGTLSYNWSNNSTSKNLANVGNGSYNVTVTDGGGKTATLPNAVVLNSMTVTSQKVDPTPGNNNGSITLTVSGGNQPPAFLWSNNATTKDVNNLAAGNYSYTVTDAAGCKTGPVSVSIGSVSVALDITSIVTTGPSCSGQATGSISITPVGGTGPYTAAWTGPNGYTSTNEDIAGLKAGTYKVTVKDANGASKTSDNIVLADAGSPLTVSGTIKQPTKAGNDGEIAITVTGGVPSYAFRWSDGSSSKDKTALNPGDYTVTVTDSKGCSTTSTTFKLAVNNGTCFTSIRAFTPNGDGINELFIISCAETISNQLLVYNRWNQLVYTANNYRNDWIGIDNTGFKLPDGTYYWILKDNSGTTNSLYKGYVSLIRSLN